MSWKNRVVLLLASSVTAYGCVSAYIVSASLVPGGECGPSGGPPPGLTLETVELTSPADGIRLAGWLAPAMSRRGVILVHGIDSDAWSGAAADLVRAYGHAGFDVLLFDLRAHGRSGGDRISLGKLEREDVRAAVEALRGHGVPAGRIGLHGTSYGAAMALLAAAEIPDVGAVVADGAFADARDLIGSQVGRRTHVPGFVAASLMRPGIEVAARAIFGLDLASLAPERVVPRIAPRPLLIVQGTRDSVVPSDHARRLKDRAVGPEAELWMMEGMGHTEGIRLGPCHQKPAPAREQYLERVVSFMDAALG